MRALITGVTGQDGSYLAEHLLGLGYEVHGVVRRCSGDNLSRIAHLRDITLHYGDVTDSSFMSGLIQQIVPDEVYNLAAQSDVSVSFVCPVYTTNTVCLGTLNILEACKGSDIKIYQASSSEMYGGLSEDPLDETSLMQPRSPYAAAKLMAHNLARIYRESYGMFICCGILFNHTSPRRGGEFVEKKIALAIDRIKHDESAILRLGNLYSDRDFGHAKDYVAAMHMMLQHTSADDYVIASGMSTRIKDLVTRMFELSGMPLTWVGHALEEKAFFRSRLVVEIDEFLYRPLEVPRLLGDSKKAQSVLGWLPTRHLDDILGELLVKKSEFR